MKLRRFIICVGAVFSAVIPAVADVTVQDVVPVQDVVAVELADGTSPSGDLAGLSDASLDLVVEGSRKSLPVRDVRSITWKRADEPPARRRAVRVGLVDGSSLDGDDLIVSEKAASLVQDGRTLAIARESIETADFAAAGGDGVGRADGAEAADGNPPAWLAKLREGGQEKAAASDVVVVGSADKIEFVECAIVAVAPDAVSVLLDDETIRVKRSRVIGLKWLRTADGGRNGGAAPPPSAVVEFDGGRLLAKRIAVEGGDVVIGLAAGEPIRVPSAAMRRIDFAAGRTVSLVAVEPDTVMVEPWFGLFKAVDGLAGHFEPRKVAVPAGMIGGKPGGGGRWGLRLRPRTVIEWRLPEHSRSVAMTVAESSSLVVIAIDGREVYRGQPSEPVPVVAEASGARRLTVTVDFPPAFPSGGGPASPGVVLVEPRIER